MSATEHLLDWLGASCRGARIVYTSLVAVLDRNGPAREPLSESSPQTPRTAYGRTKLRGEYTRPAHGPPIDDPRAVVERYLRHREYRERQVLAAAQSGHMTLESIVDTVYDGLTEALRGAARETVLARLIKQEEDEAVVRERGEWHATRRTAWGEGVPASEPLGGVQGSPPFKQ